MPESHKRSSLLLAGLLLYFTSLHLSVGYADVTASGLGTSVNNVGNDFNISGGTLSNNGQNLFHSFGRFSLTSTQSAIFLNNSALTPTNILSRVTGGDPSSIYGTIDTMAFPGANLYLINPAGIFFGPSAQLNVDGSFHATTADYIRLADMRFDSNTSEVDATLMTAAPEAFGFLTSNPASIDVQTGSFDFNTGSINNLLQVPAGQTLSLVGGPISIGPPSGEPPGGFIFAPDGLVNIVSVASPGEATFTSPINVDSFTQLGNVLIRGNALVDAREIYVRAGQLEIKDAALFPGFFYLFGAPVPPPNGGEVNIDVSDYLTITGENPPILAVPGITTFAGSPGGLEAGDAPDINIQANLLYMSGSAAIQTNRFGPGNAANTMITADTVELHSGAVINILNSFGGGPYPTSGGSLIINGNNMTLSSDGTGLQTGIFSNGLFYPAYGQPGVPFLPFFQFADSAPITINLTDTLTMLENSVITTDSAAFGNSGDLSITARKIVLSGSGEETGTIAAQSVIAGNSGDLTLAADNIIQIDNGFRVSANTFGSGSGGTAELIAGEGIVLTGSNSRVLSGTLQLPDQELNDFARLFDPVLQFLGAPPITDYATLRDVLGVEPRPGDIMDVLRVLSTIEVGGNPLVAVTDFTPGDAGAISITTPMLTMNADTRIETSTGWGELDPSTNEIVGNAGDVTVDVGSLFLNDGAAIRSRSGIQRLSGEFSIGAGNAGTVTITASDTNTISISGRSPTTGNGSSVSTTTLGDGNGGDIELTSAGRIELKNGGEVTADSLGGTGLAGNISISAGKKINLSKGTISTRAVTSDGGDIDITAQDWVYLLDSAITTSVESGLGGGGNITIDPDFVILNNSNILANAYGGPGGNINIVAGNVISSAQSLIDASSALGINGTVNISSPDQEVAQELAVLPENFLDISGLISDRCGARAGASSLVPVGPGGLTVDPDGYLPSFGAPTSPGGSSGQEKGDPGNSSRWWGPAVDPSVLQLAQVTCI